MTKSKDTDERAAVAARIAAMPTASDAQVAAAVSEERAEKVSRELVTDVRAEMGPKHTWAAEDEK